MTFMSDTNIIASRSVPGDLIYTNDAAWVGNQIICVDEHSYVTYVSSDFDITVALKGSIIAFVVTICNTQNNKYIHGSQHWYYVITSTQKQCWISGEEYIKITN